MKYIRFALFVLSATVLITGAVAAQMFPGVALSTAPPSAEELALKKLMTENALEREKNFQRLKKLTDERDELQIRSMSLTEKQRLDTSDLDGELKKLSLQNAIASEKERLANSPREAEYKSLSIDANLASERARAALAEERQAYDKLALDNNTTSERQKLSLSDERQAYEKLSLDATLASEKARAALADERQAYDKLSLDNNTASEKLKLSLADGRSLFDKLALDNSLASEKLRMSLAPQREQAEKLKLDNELAREQLEAQMIKDDAEKAAMDLEIRRIDFQSRKLRFDAEQLESKTVALKTDLELRSQKEKWKAESNHDPDYVMAPFKDGRLVISDRRVALNGPIIRGTADYVTERIEYFNNKSESQPIFIVIDDCPGGSVMQGYRIVKAMQASKAPVHVVVKSFAASMAAVITTLAPHSYAYPNAVILHHQMSSMLWGNMTNMKEQLEISKEWYRRLAEPVAEKMGVSQEKMVKLMYEHNSEGDWEEFADKAKKLHWVDNIVDDIRETGVVKEPTGEAPAPKLFFMTKEEVDPKGERYVVLPRLEPFDFYYIYNPDHYYR